MIKHFAILFPMICLIACKKDKLEDDKNALTGRWVWQYSSYSDYCNPPYTIHKTLTPVSENRNYALEFKEKGCVSFFEDDELIDKRRLVFNTFTINDTGAINFSIYLDNDKENVLSGIGSAAKMRIFYHPYVSTACETYENYFVKE